MARLTIVAILVALSFGASSLGAQSNRPPRLQIASTRDAQPLSIAGIVVDQATGSPLSSVLVDSGNQATLTDTLGYFALRLPRAGEEWIRLAKLGHEPREIPLRVSAEDGIVVFAEMRKSKPMCEYIVVAPPGGRPAGPQRPHIRAEIRDVRTGRAPSMPIEVRAHAPAWADSVRLDPVDGSHLELLFDVPPEVVSRSEPLMMEVTSAAYRTVSFRDIWFEHGCPSDRTPLLRVWLMPADSR